MMKKKSERIIRKAHWIAYSYLFRDDEYVCSVCGEVSDRPYRVCPSCGVRRRKSTETVFSWEDELECASALLDNDW